MNKAETAKALGVSERTVANYVSKGHLNVTYIQGRTRDVADFDPNEVARLKVELGNNATEPGNPETEQTVQVRNSETGNQESGNNEKAIVPFARFPSPETVQSRVVLIGLTEEQFAQLAKRPDMEVPLDKKMALTFPEAAQLSGVSEHQLRKAVKAGEITTKRIGRSDKVRPSDLQLWVEQQFQG